MKYFAAVILSAGTLLVSPPAQAQYGLDDSYNTPPGRALVEKRQQQFERDLEYMNNQARMRARQSTQRPQHQDLKRTNAARAYKGKYRLKPDEYAALTARDLENYQEDVQSSDLNGSSITRTIRWAMVEILDVKLTEAGEKMFRVRVPKGKTAYWVFESALISPTKKK